MGVAPAAEEGEKMDIVKEYLLSQYEELGELNGNPCVSIVKYSHGKDCSQKKDGDWAETDL